MAKTVHMMVRVLDEARSVKFYESCFGLKVSDRRDWPDFTLIYLKNPENDFELELTVNKGRADAYDLGNGYGHIAFVVDDLDAERARQSAHDGRVEFEVVVRHRFSPRSGSQTRRY